jgi:LCP family protein required for cell wall assembly
VEGAPPEAGPVVHVVRRGETLYSIARRYGTTVGAIMRANNLRSYTIYVGQRLMIPVGGLSGYAPAPSTAQPTSTSSTYVVQSGDTLYSIARRFGTTVWAIARANGIANPNWIRRGQRLIIPGWSVAPSLTSGSLTLSTSKINRISPILNQPGRVNVLLLGLDQREGETGPCRSDTIIVASLNPQDRSAYLVSIPRDLWVYIPGRGWNRVNTAHFYGGPTLAEATVERLLKAPIHHCVSLKFRGFEKAIDALGGVVITVDRPIVDHLYPDERWGYTSIYIPAGTQRMDGKTALRYVRSRHGRGDFDRIRRQQKLLQALREQVGGWDLLFKVPSILAALRGELWTDLSLREVLSLIQLVLAIESQNIAYEVIK